MRNWMIVMAALGALGFVLAACGGTEEPKAEEPKAEEPKAEEPKAEEPKAEAGAAGSPCEAYAKCCTEYADAMSGVAGVTEDIVKMQKDSCAAIEGLKAAPGADESCKTAMDGMKAGAAAYEAMPGFTMPASCK